MDISVEIKRHEFGVEFAPEFFELFIRQSQHLFDPWCEFFVTHLIAAPNIEIQAILKLIR